MRRRGYSTEPGLTFGTTAYRYNLVPWVWDTSVPSRPYWRLPTSSVGGVDLRPLPAQSPAGGTPQGHAFAASLQSPGGIALAAAFHMNETASSTPMRDAWLAGTGYRPNGATLTDLLWDQLTAGSDPTGQSGPKPLLPDTEGQLKLFVGGHSLVKSERFVWGVHPHTNRIRDLLRREFEERWEATDGHDHNRRILDFTCNKYGVGDWREFVPARLHAHVPGRLSHATTITESFNTADSSTLGPDLSWVEYDGNTPTDTWEVAGNAASCTVAGSANALARAESDLSGDDHYAQADVTALGSGGDNCQAGTACRFSASAATCYFTRALQVLDTLQLEKIVAGTITNLGSGQAIVIAVPDSVKVQADGSTVKGYYNGSELYSVTDTAITSNTRCGIWGYAGGGPGTAKLDSFEAADLSGGVITQSVNQVTETDLAQPVTWAPKRRLVNLIVETDLAQSLTRRKTVAVAQCSETDLAQTLSRLKRITLGQITETDLAQAITRLKSRVLGINTETDSAQPVDWNPARRLVNQATETDLSQSVTGVTGNTVVVNQVTETDLSQALTRLKIKALGMCSETDLAQALQGLKTRLLGLATETDSAQTVNRIKTYTLGFPQETDFAQTLRLSPFARLIVQVVETDSAVAITAIGGDTVWGPYYVDKQSWFGPGPVKMLGFVPGATVGAYQ